MSKPASDPERQPDEASEGGQRAGDQKRQDHCLGQEGEPAGGLIRHLLASGRQGGLAVVDRNVLGLLVTR
jgi:hypothetical protein